MKSLIYNGLLALFALTLPIVHGQAAEVARLTPQTWDEYAPQGKEADCIYGDYVLRNEHFVAVVAQPLSTRNANMTVRGVGAMLIDLTRRRAQRDQLSAYYANGIPLVFDESDQVAITVDGQPVEATEGLQRSGGSIVWQCTTDGPSGVQVTVKYTVADNARALAVDTVIRNPGQQQVTLELSDLIRADRTFAFGSDEATGLFWADDEWFRQAYGVIVEGRRVERGGGRGSVLRLLDGDTAAVRVAPGGRHVLRRKIIPGGSLLEVRGAAMRMAGEAVRRTVVEVTDPAGPVTHAQVTLLRDGQPYASARTGARGRLAFDAPLGSFRLRVEANGRTPQEVDGEIASGDDPHRVQVTLDGCGYVVGRITDHQRGGPIPCKIAFHGTDGTPTPDFGPDSGEVAVKNLHYSHNGRFRQEIAPGKYEVIISYGPEYDAVFAEIEVQRGQETRLAAQLKRVVDTSGWVSSDFHSHSSPSGDNTSSQLGRVLNLLCENVEFCPCTEHNRIDTYVPHLERLGVRHQMATCSGIELTGQPLPVNHQNAFPLIHQPRTQDGGAPVTDANPVVQIERLALWDGGSDKLVQENHPNLVQILGDKDLDGKPDGGFEQMFGFMDVIEVHPPEGIFTKPEPDERGQLSRNPIFHWMQLLNLGYRIPGVVNTDAHYNYHESGWLRNYLKSRTDDPAEVDTMDMVHAAEAGHLVMTTGPFMEVALKAARESDKPSGIPGDDVIAPYGEAQLSVRVQCSNWLDINRVQVFLNGRAEPTLNFTRRTTPERFAGAVVKFEQTLPLELDKDTHVIVAAIGEGLQLGRVMGPVWGEKPPVVVSNPIFVDVDGDGFKANGDLLDVPLAGQEGEIGR